MQTRIGVGRRGPGQAALWLVLFAIWLGGAPARAEGGLDLQPWLDRPGVRAVVVEFYSTWCEPCMKAMPRWKALKDKYGRQGLRIIVVKQTPEDEPDRCTPLGWTPDEQICDTTGELMQRFGVKGLPSAFLWSWDRRLLVQRGHVDEVERAVEDLFSAQPVVAIEPEPATPPEWVEQLTDALTLSAKMRVVASSAEREAMRRLREAQSGLHVDDASRCELGKELAPNSLLSVGPAADGVRLRLFDIETNCLIQSATGPSVRDAVENLLGRMRVPLQWPGGAVSPVVPPPIVTVPPPVEPSATIAVTQSIAAPAELRPTGATFSLDEPGDHWVLTSFETSPEGAVVMIDNQLACQHAPCTRNVPPGPHRVVASLDEHEEASARVELLAEGRVALTLVPAYALVDVETTPPWLTLSIDGRDAGPAPLMGLHLAPGTHLIRTTDACHEPREERVTVRKGERRSVTLQPAVRQASVMVQPKDARGNDVSGRVWAENVLAGAAWKTVSVPACATSVSLRLPGGDQRSVDLPTDDGTVRKVMVRLDPEPPLVALLQHDLGEASGRVPDLETRRARYGRACREGDPATCLLESAQVLPLPSTVRPDVPALLKACDEDRYASCLAASVLLGRPSVDAATGLVGEPLDPGGAITAARHWCESGGLQGCREQGRLTLRGVGAVRDAVAGLALLQKACEGKDAVACRYWGEALASGADGRPDPSRAAPLMQRACDDADLGGCVRLGRAYREGAGVGRDDIRAVALLRKACDGGAGDGCAELAQHFLEGRGVARDESRGVELQLMACEAGVVAACVPAGEALANGRGVARDPERSVQLLRRACDGGQPAACHLLAGAYASGTGVEKEPATAATLHQKACDARELSSCSALGLMFKQGLGVARDDKRGAELYRRACDGNERAGCRNLAFSYETGSGVDRDLAESLRLYEKSCTLGDAPGCRNHGLARLAGKGLMFKDPAGAAVSLDKACERGDAKGCLALGALRRDGDGVPRDAVRARAAFQKACDGGESAACRQLGGLIERESPEKVGVLYHRACYAKDPPSCAAYAAVLALGEPSRRDPAAAGQLYRFACQQGDEIGCAAQAALSGATLDGAVRDRYRKGCSERRAEACVALGIVTEKGLGESPRPDDARQLFADACEKGVPSACLRRAAVPVPPEDKTPFKGYEVAFEGRGYRDQLDQLQVADFTNFGLAVRFYPWRHVGLVLSAGASAGTLLTSLWDARAGLRFRLSDPGDVIGLFAEATGGALMQADQVRGESVELVAGAHLLLLEAGLVGRWEMALQPGDITPAKPFLLGARAAVKF